MPQRLASQIILQSVSEPLLREADKSMNQTTKESYDFADGQPQRSVFTSELHSNRVPIAWGLPKKYAASSIYSQDTTNNYAAASVYSQESPYITPAESKQGSMMFLNEIADRMNHYGPDAPARDMISVPTAKQKHIDLERLERRTRDTSFHSSNEKPVQS